MKLEIQIKKYIINELPTTIEMKQYLEIILTRIALLLK